MNERAVSFATSFYQAARNTRLHRRLFQEFIVQTRCILRLGKGQTQALFR